MIVRKMKMNCTYQGIADETKAETKEDENCDCVFQ